MSKIIVGLHLIWKIVWRIGLFFIVWGTTISLFFVPLGSRLFKWQQLSPISAQFYIDVVGAITILAASWSMTRFIDHRPFRTIGLGTDHFSREIIGGLAIGTVWLGISLVIAWILGWASPLAPVGFSWHILIGTMIAMLFNVFTQELLLCGFIFQTIRRRSNVIVAIVVSAILFSGYHAGAFKGAWLPPLNIFGAGVLFCLAYVITGKLWFPIAIHFAWDVLLGPVLGLTESGKNNLGGNWKMFDIQGPSLFTGGAFGLEGGLIVTITVSIAIFLLYYYKARKLEY
ncbi:MAG: type II CAAX endopeptidase family protein [Ignavibacteriaceae bacterium]|nr:type II CAAX endopeptidase family protein [Ignavibacteriaceae bacterium]